MSPADYVHGECERKKLHLRGIQLLFNPIVGLAFAYVAQPRNEGTEGVVVSRVPMRLLTLAEATVLFLR